MARGEHELRDGIALASTIGERRLLVLLKASLAVVVADEGRPDEARPIAEEGLAEADALGLLFCQTEAKRGLAHACLRGGEPEESIRLCEDIVTMLAGKEPKVTLLYLGPTHIEALLAAGQLERAQAACRAYAATVAECQSPFYSGEAARLAGQLAAAH